MPEASARMISLTEFFLFMSFQSHVICSSHAGHKAVVTWKTQEVIRMTKSFTQTHTVHTSFCVYYYYGNEFC